MSYRIAHSLDALRTQINNAFPTRNKISDGWIGNKEHQSRDSDHNPWIVIQENGRNIRIVTALDITHDPSVGLDSERLAEELIRSRDPRIKYIISNRKIISGNDGPSPWQWRRYEGNNAHSYHVHISVEDKKELFDDDKSWWFDFTKIEEPINHIKPPNKPLLKRGSKGKAVKELQEALNRREGENLKIDGDFGPVTERAVRLFQRTHGLTVDGKVGPYTWEKLL